MSNSRDKIYKGIYDDFNESINAISNTLQGATNSVAQVLGDTTQAILSLLNPKQAKEDYLPKETGDSKTTTGTNGDGSNEQKNRKTRAYSANVTASIALEGAKFRTLTQPSFFESVY